MSIIYKRVDRGVLTAEVAPVAGWGGWDGFEKIARFFVSDLGAELVVEADGPDARRRVFHVRGARIFLDYLDFEDENFFYADDPDSEPLVKELARAFERLQRGEEHETDRLATESCSEKVDRLVASVEAFKTQFAVDLTFVEKYEPLYYVYRCTPLPGSAEPFRLLRPPRRVDFDYIKGCIIRALVDCLADRWCTYYYWAGAVWRQETRPGEEPEGS